MHNAEYVDVPRSHGRAPNLSLSIPRRSDNPPMTSNEILPSRGAHREDANESDRSSICQSPGWNDSESKRRKKDKQKAKSKCRKGKEKADTEAKSRTPRKRLTKPPPRSTDVSKLDTSMPRAESPYAMQIIPQLVGNQPAYNERRIRNEAGPGRLVPWKSAGSASPKVEEHGNEGFIDGIKIQRAVHHSCQEVIRNQTASVVEPRRSHFREESAVDEPEQDTPLGKGEVNGPDLDVSQQVAGEDVSNIEWSIDKGRKGNSLSESSSPQRSPTKKARPVVPQISAPAISLKDRKSPTPSQQLSNPSSDRPLTSYGEPLKIVNAESRRTRRGSFRFLRNRPQSSHDGSANTSQDETPASKASSIISTERHSRGRSWSIHNGSRTSSRTMTENIMQSNKSKDNDPGQPFSAASRGLISAPLGTGFVSEESFPVEGEDSRPTSFQGLKKAAKAAFSRQPHSFKPVPPKLDSNEAIAVEGTQVQPSSDNFPPPYCLRSAPQSPSKDAMLSFEEEHQKFTHRSSVCSSKYISKDEMQISAEVARSGSSVLQNDYDAHLQQNISNEQSSNNNSISDGTTGGAAPPAAHHLPLASQTPPFEALRDGSVPIIAVRGEHSFVNGRQAAQPELDKLKERDRNRLRPKRSSQESPSNFKPPSSSSKSTSSTDLQDMSFLPTLGHQTLTRIAKGKAQENPPLDPIDYSVQNSTKVLHAAPLPTTPSSSPSSPTSPKATSAHSAQYLQNARQNLPPSASASRVSLTSTGSQDRNTLAKIFVICCHCRHYHDMPSKIYECMVKPDSVVADRKLGVSGVISTAVKCPWCRHGMSTGCCEGWAAVVVLRERLH